MTALLVLVLRAEEDALLGLLRTVAVFAAANDIVTSGLSDLVLVLSAIPLRLVQMFRLGLVLVEAVVAAALDGVNVADGSAAYCLGAACELFLVADVAFSTFVVPSACLLRCPVLPVCGLGFTEADWPANALAAAWSAALCLVIVRLSWPSAAVEFVALILLISPAVLAFRSDKPACACGFIDPLIVDS